MRNVPTRRDFVLRQEQDIRQHVYPTEDDVGKKSWFVDIDIHLARELMSPYANTDGIGTCVIHRSGYLHPVAVFGMTYIDRDFTTIESVLVKQWRNKLWIQGNPLKFGSAEDIMKAYGLRYTVICEGKLVFNLN